MSRIGRVLATMGTTLLLIGASTTKVANVTAALPPGVRSGERMRFVPEEIQAIQRVIEAEGARGGDATELAQIVHSESRALHLDPLFALALIKIESGFRAGALSRHGARGLLQVRPVAARSIAAAPRADVGSCDGPLEDPRTNVAVGLRYLRDLQRRFGDESTALAAYNIGPTRVRRRLERGGRVPAAYAERVLATYRALRAGGDAATASPSSPPRG